MEMRTANQIKIRPMLISCVVVYCLIVLGIVIVIPEHSLELSFFSTYVALACGCIPLPTTQMVMIYARQYDPALIAILGGIAYCISALIDYSLVTFAFRHKRAGRIKTTRIYCWLERIFIKWPFGTLALDSFSVIPFEPIKLMACAKQYDRRKYLLACFIGRTVRYYLIGVSTTILPIANKYLYASIIVMLAMELVRRLVKIVKGRSSTNNRKDSTADLTQYRDNLVSQYSEDMAA